jgi:hypothetical protein
MEGENNGPWGHLTQTLFVVSRKKIKNINNKVKSKELKLQ